LTDVDGNVLENYRTNIDCRFQDELILQALDERTPRFSKQGSRERTSLVHQVYRNTVLQ
jgi:hypothetical protein